MLFRLAALSLSAGEKKSSAIFKQSLFLLVSLDFVSVLSCLVDVHDVVNKL